MVTLLRPMIRAQSGAIQESEFAFLSENIHGVYMLLVTAKATVPSRPCYSGLKFSRVAWVCASARNSRANKSAAIGRSLKKIL